MIHQILKLNPNSILVAPISISKPKPSSYVAPQNHGSPSQTPNPLFVVPEAVPQSARIFKHHLPSSVVALCYTRIHVCEIIRRMLRSSVSLYSKAKVVMPFTSSDGAHVVREKVLPGIRFGCVVKGHGLSFVPSAEADAEPEESGVTKWLRHVRMRMNNDENRPIWGQPCVSVRTILAPRRSFLTAWSVAWGRSRFS
ncbi:hypothetical protein BJ508DRAFT_81595 [Ascobolus immersus RN42]|uniref:Uncharacterized protein n=1 Tax=Ascobolus immersus RN42 TaxID=1160509 RepID=A0A3N4IBX7_ASCIM|nr:hypothetical protein BJ508DRAFT_81595 [Ascobolus immersus RN42]